MLGLIELARHAMTATLTPITHAQIPLAREVVAPATASRGAAPATATVSAQALRPVDPGSRAADLRLPASRDRPVGPPPAFDINVLEDLRERMAEAAAPETAPGQEASDRSRDAAPAPDVAHHLRDAVEAEAPTAPMLDRKV
jgi:hypothetical protein